MSRTYKDRVHRRRFVKNSLYQKILRLFSDDFCHRRKDKTLTKRLRRKLEIEVKKIICGRKLDDKNE